jgi:hypothetical protein
MPPTHDSLAAFFNDLSRGKPVHAAEFHSSSLRAWAQVDADGEIEIGVQGDGGGECRLYEDTAARLITHALPCHNQGWFFGPLNRWTMRRQAGTLAMLERMFVRRDAGSGGRR